MRLSLLVVALSWGMSSAAPRAASFPSHGLPNTTSCARHPNAADPQSALSNPRALRSGQAAALSGGPDGFGYCYVSTQDPGDSIVYEWTDALAGAAVTDWTPGPDDGYASLSLPFPFPFYDETLSTINICSNGFLETSTSVQYLNAPLPTGDVANLIAPFWDDLSLSSAGTVYRYVPPDSSCFVVAFVGVARYETPDDRETFEVVLYPDGRIRFNYQQVTGDRGSNTIGIQGDDGSREWYLEYVADGNPGSHVVGDSTSVMFRLDRRDHDVGVSCVRSPAPLFAPGTSQPVVAKVRNFGRLTESFNVGGIVVNAGSPFDTLFAISGIPVSNLATDDTLLVNLGTFVPAGQGTWQVKLFTELAGDEQLDNDTARSMVTNSVPFGTPLAAWNLNAMPTGFALGGITFCSDSDRFYLTARDPNQVYSFAPGDPSGTLRPESFQLQNLFGNDAIWGIAFDRFRHSFWIGHVEGSGNGTVVARYLADGSFTGDTWNLWSFEPNAWCAGMDYDPEQDRGYVTKVSGTNAIYEVDFAAKRVYRIIPGGTQSYRACSYFQHGSACWLLSGGWNQNQLLRLDTLGNVGAGVTLESLADCDVYQPENPNPDSFAYAIATLSNQANTIKKISLGVTWRQLGIAEPSRPAARNPQSPILLACPSPQRNPVSILLYVPSAASGSIQSAIRLELFDLTGRQIGAGFRVALGRAGPLRATIPGTIAPGVYCLVAQSNGQMPQQKLVVVR